MSENIFFDSKKNTRHHGEKKVKWSEGTDNCFVWKDNNRWWVIFHLTRWRSKFQSKIEPEYSRQFCFLEKKDMLFKAETVDWIIWMLKNREDYRVCWYNDEQLVVQEDRDRWSIGKIKTAYYRASSLW